MLIMVIVLHFELNVVLQIPKTREISYWFWPWKKERKVCGKKRQFQVDKSEKTKKMEKYPWEHNFLWCSHMRHSSTQSSLELYVLYSELSNGHNSFSKEAQPSQEYFEAKFHQKPHRKPDNFWPEIMRGLPGFPQQKQDLCSTFEKKKYWEWRKVWRKE